MFIRFIKQFGYTFVLITLISSIIQHLDFVLSFLFSLIFTLIIFIVKEQFFKQKEYLPKLSDDESIIQKFLVSLNKKGGFLYVTNKRIIFIDSYFKGEKEESFIFNEIIGVIMPKNKWLYSNKMMFKTIIKINIVIKIKKNEDLFSLLKENIKYPLIIH